MPNVISRSIIVTDDRDEQEIEQTRLNSYRCLCGAMALISEVPIDKMPQRHVDGARAHKVAASKFKLYSTPGRVVLVKREQGYERQFREKCRNCNLMLAYRCPTADSERIYFVNGGFLREGVESDILPSKVDWERNQASEKEKLDIEARRAARGAGISTSGSAQEEDQLKQQKEMGASYDSNAKVIEMYIGRGAVGKAADEIKKAAAAKKAKRKRGTLLI